MGLYRSSSSLLSFKTVCGSVAVPGIILLLLIGTLQQNEGRFKTKTAALSTTSHQQYYSAAGSPEHVKVTGRPKALLHPQLDINYMSKRRVPNGPDPIHNRRAGNSKRPPGQA